jgi:hypothetical protein
LVVFSSATSNSKVSSQVGSRPEAAASSKQQDWAGCDGSRGLVIGE